MQDEIDEITGEIDDKIFESLQKNNEDAKEQLKLSIEELNQKYNDQKQKQKNLEKEREAAKQAEFLKKKQAHEDVERMQQRLRDH